MSSTCRGVLMDKMCSFMMTHVVKADIEGKSRILSIKNGGGAGQILVMPASANVENYKN